MGFSLNNYENILFIMPKKIIKIASFVLIQRLEESEMNLNDVTDDNTVT